MITHQAHPASMQHTALPYGQPMPPVQTPNSGQPVAQPGQPQMHPGMPGPNGSHMNQAGAMMAGMHPAVGGGGPGAPTAHALSHLQPQAMFSNPQMAQAYANNPAAVFQYQQQLQRQNQAMMQAQAANGMAVIPQGGNVQYNPAQYARAMQNPNHFPGVNLPQHLRYAHQQTTRARHEQMLQMTAMQNAQINNQGQAVHPAHPMRPQQSMQGMHESQVAAAQQQQQQQQQRQQQQQQQQQQPQQQQQLQQLQLQQQQQQQQQQQPQQHHAQTQPQVNHQGPSEQQHQQSQEHQRPSQQQPPQQVPPPNAQQPTPNPQHQHIQLHQQQQQNQRQQQQQNQQQQQLTQDQQAREEAQKVQARQLLAQNHAIMQNQATNMSSGLTRPQQANVLTTTGLQHLAKFSEVLGSACENNPLNDITQWRGIVSEFFSDEGAFRNRLWYSNGDTPKAYEICAPALARYFWIHFDSGVERMQLVTIGAREKHSPSNNSYYVETPENKATISYWYGNGVQLVCTGTLKAMLNSNGKFEWMEFLTSRHEEYLARRELISLFRPASPTDKHSPPKPSKTSTKLKAQRVQEQQKEQDQMIKFADLPPTPLRPDGTTLQLGRFLEMVETMSTMRELFEFSHLHPQLAPAEALTRLVENLQQQQQPSPHIGLPFNTSPNQALPSGYHTPGLNGPVSGLHNGHHFTSPAHTTLNIPGNHMNNASPRITDNSSAQAAHMAPQHSQHGTSSSANASSNASPNVTSKRRRVSGVKQEGTEDISGAREVNGVGGGAAKVKPSPRISGKRQKAS